MLKSTGTIYPRNVEKLGRGALRTINECPKAGLFDPSPSGPRGLDILSLPFRHKMPRRARIAALNLNGRRIMNTQLLQQASVLDIDEQIELVEAIWDGIVSRGAAPLLTEAQKTELDRRLAEHLANPNDVIPWSEVKAAALAKIRQ